MSMILSTLGIEPSTLYFHDRMNLYHTGDKIPFANVLIRDGHYCLRVGGGEKYDRASNVSLGKYGRN